MSSLHFYYEGHRYVANDANQDGVLNLDQEQFLDEQGRSLDRSDARIDQFKSLAGSERSASQIPLANLQLNAAARLASLDRYQLLEQLAAARSGHSSDEVSLGTAATAALREEAQTIIAENHELLQNLSSSGTLVNRALLGVTLTRLQNLESSLNISSPQRASQSSTSSVALGFGLLALSVSAFFVAPRLIPLGFLALASAAFFAGCAPSASSPSESRASEEPLNAHSSALAGIACAENETLENASCFTYNPTTSEETQSAIRFNCSEIPEHIETNNKNISYNEDQLNSLRAYCRGLLSSPANLGSSAAQSFVCFATNSSSSILRLRAEASCVRNN